VGIHGFVGKKTEDPQAMKLLTAASEYATAAMCRMVQDASGAPSALPHLIDDYIDTVFGLEVHFVFPNLSADERDLLVEMMKVRNSISAVLNGASRWDSTGEKATLTADLEQKFMEFRSQIVESGIEEQLDPLQKRVFQDEFFSITLDKARSTTLFFRTDAAPRTGSWLGAAKESEAAEWFAPSVGRALREGIAPVEPPLQDIKPQVLMPSQSAQPVIERDIAFPLPEAKPQLPEVTPHLVEQRAPRRKTVLLISSDSGVQDLARRALREAGYSLLLANAGFTGYATAMRERPDLVLVDLSLSSEASGPDAYLDGRGVLKMLSKLPSGRALPFIGLASNDTSENQVLESGAKACLQKPLDPALVLVAVNACVDLETDEASRSPWTVSASV
jgi:CheY-like chemotaxis protein